MAKSQKAYFGLPYLVSLILAIIPLTSWFCGAITRISRGHIIAGILQLIPPITFVFWILDIVSIATSKDITFYA